jgi:hypothetical protein
MPEIKLSIKRLAGAGYYTLSIQTGLTRQSTFDILKPLRISNTPKWRNWQTRTTQTRVPSGVWVRFPPSAHVTPEPNPNDMVRFLSMLRFDQRKNLDKFLVETPFDINRTYAVR